LILVTGATGFIGSALVARAVSESLPVRATARRRQTESPRGIERVVVGDMTTEADWRPALRGVDVVVHTAARAHIMRDSAGDPLGEYRRVNVAGTLRLARQAADAGARRFVFISSIKVNGEQTAPGTPFTADDAPAPIDPYGVSKHEAEQGLRGLAEASQLEVVIVRPVLVYGPGVKANFRAMMRWLKRGVPLPLGAIHNQRSLVALDNLVDMLMTCIHHRAAANHTFLVSDGEDLSTTALLRRMGAAMGKPARLVPVPETVLRAGAAVLGKQDLARRLFGSLQVDILKTRQLLDWVPPISVDEGLRRAAASLDIPSA
jgi:nucleoside-diphosphate-sugar epimerase